jgi:hypothetical protein
MDCSLRLAMWLLSITSTASAFFVPTTTLLPPSRNVLRAHRVCACVNAQDAATTEVPPQSVFAALDYNEDFVPWDIGEAQPPVRKAARGGAFGGAGTTILDCGCGAGDNANWLAARGTYVSIALAISGSTATRAASHPPDMAGQHGPANSLAEAGRSS